MTRKQLHKHLTLIHRDLSKVELRMEKVSDKLGFDRGHEHLEKTLWEVEELLKMFGDTDESS